MQPPSTTVPMLPTIPGGKPSPRWPRGTEEGKKVTASPAKEPCCSAVQTRGVQLSRGTRLKRYSSSQPSMLSAGCSEMPHDDRALLKGRWLQHCRRGAGQGKRSQTFSLHNHRATMTSHNVFEIRQQQFIRVETRNWVCTTNTVFTLKRRKTF